MQNINRYWVAGLLEGEGSFMSGPPSNPCQPLISCELTDKDTINKVALIFGTKPIFIKKRKINWSNTWVVRKRGKGAVEIMKEILPIMGSRRRNQIQKAIKSYKDNTSRFIPKKDYNSILERINNGESYKKIAKDYGVTKWAIYRLKERLGF